jgi:glycosyltransferase involved in cell wall biosynthesis
MTDTQPTEAITTSEDKRPQASVVIRNRNERKYLERVLSVLSLQTVRPEIVVVDNESTDGSAEIAAASGAKLVHLKKSEFTYGHAVNVGVADASAEIIVMLSAHSLPLGDRFIENCLKPFSDPRVAAVRCLMLYFDDESLEGLQSLEVKFREGWLNSKIKEGSLEKLRWGARLARLQELPQNNGCAFRKAVWRALPFDEKIEYGEDTLWSYQVLDAGYRIATASAWYQYFPTHGKFWPSLRRYRREQIALYRLGADKLPLRRVVRDIMVAAPRAGAAVAARIVFKSVIAAMAPWYAQRPSQKGSIQ